MLGSKRQISLLVIIFFAAPKILFAQPAPSIEWQRCLGGSGDDEAKCMIQTSDGGYAVVGYNSSKDGDVKGSLGKKDAWIVKLSPSNSILRQDCYGGGGDEQFNSIIRTSDGGYAIAGTISSNDGDADVGGKHGTLHSDAWVVKLNASWIVEWQKCYGGSNDDIANAICQTSDGGYLIAGSTTSIDGDVSGKHLGTFNTDVWVVKADPAGTIEWQKCLGGKGDEFGNSILQTSDGGCIVAGKTNSLGGDVAGLHFDTTLGANYDPDHDGDIEANEGEGGFDAWVVKLDSSHNIEWQRCYGGIRMDAAYSIIHSPNGGYVFAGSTESDDGDVSGNHSIPPSLTVRDGWVVEIDSSGTIVWQSCLGGRGNDEIFSLIHTSDGGYAVGGWSNSDDESFFNHGRSDAWIVKLNSSGKTQWQKFFGGKSDDGAASVIQTSDKSLAFAGYTTSNDGDVIGFHMPDTTLVTYDPDNDGDNEYTESNEKPKDMWVVKLNAPSGVNTNTTSSRFQLFTYPNPSSKIITVGYDLPKISPVEITIYNLTGECIKEILQPGDHAGHHETKLDLAGCSEGSYFIKITACGLSETASVEVVR